MRLGLPLIAVLVAATLALLSEAAPAGAAVPCKPVQRTVRGDVNTVRVAVVNTPCETGREVTEEFYIRFDGGAPNSVKLIDGFRCTAVLASTELTCHSRGRWIFASDLPEDHPGSFHPPKQLLPVAFNCQVIYVDGSAYIFYFHLMGCYRARKLATYVANSHRAPRGFICHPRPHDEYAYCHKASNRQQTFGWYTENA